MMGVQEAPARLFYDFDLDAHVPANHILRQIDRFLDVDIVRAQLRPFYSHLGRPSIDPELIVRMLVIGYVMGIRSERRLCDEVHLNLAYRWFCGLGLDGKVPDHSTFPQAARHQNTATASSGTATCCVWSLKPSSPVAFPKVSSAVMASRSMPA